RTANRGAVLVLPQYGIGSGQERLGIKRIVHSEVIGRPVVAICAGLRNDIYKSSERPPVFGERSCVEDAEFLRRFLRRSRARQPCECLDIVRAVDQNQRTQLRLSTEREPRRRG